MTKLIKIITLTLVFNLISLQLLTIYGKEHGKPAQQPEKVNVSPNMENGQPGHSDTNSGNPNEKPDKAIVPREIEQFIGIKKYKYSIKDIANGDTLPVNCKVCILRSKQKMECCSGVKSQNFDRNCRTGEFSEIQIKDASGWSSKINICDNQGNQIATNSFSFPGKFKGATFIQTTNGLKYNLIFSPNQKPSECKLNIKTTSGDQKIESQCIEINKCDCSSGEVSLTPNLSGEIKIVVNDYFGEKIVEKTITLKEMEEKVQTIKPGEAPDGADLVQNTDGGLSGAPDNTSGAKVDTVGKDIKEEEPSKGGEEEKIAEDAAEKKVPEEVKDAQPDSKDDRAPTGGPLVPTKVEPGPTASGGGSQSETAEAKEEPAEDAKEADKPVIESDKNSSTEITIPIPTKEIDASTGAPVNTDDGQGSNGSISVGNDPIVIEPPSIIPNPDGEITTGKGNDIAVDTINNGGSDNGSTNDQDKANVPSTGRNDVPAVKPTTTASSDAPNPATNTTTTTVPSSDDVIKPGSDGGDIDDQGLSSGAIIGIIVGVMVLAGSVGGISYYMIKVKGRAS